MMTVVTVITVITVMRMQEDALDKDRSAGSLWADQGPASHWPTHWGGWRGGEGAACVVRTLQDPTLLLLQGVEL